MERPLLTKNTNLIWKVDVAAKSSKVWRKFECLYQVFRCNESNTKTFHIMFLSFKHCLFKSYKIITQRIILTFVLLVVISTDKYVCKLPHMIVEVSAPFHVIPDNPLMNRCVWASPGIALLDCLFQLSAGINKKNIIATLTSGSIEKI